MESRTEKSFRNSLFSIGGQLITLLLGFFTRTVFIKILGVSYLGINGLFTDILTLLSFTELGFGTAIVYALYKPLADADMKKTAAIMNFYKFVYAGVGITIFVLGIMVIPNLDFFIGNQSEIPAGLPPLWIIYLMYLTDTSVSYFFNYKRSIVLASQNGYLDSLNRLLFNGIRNFVQIILLVVFKSFVIYLAVQITTTFLSNVFISKKADKLFPELTVYKTERLDGKSIKEILKNVLAMMCSKVGSVAVSGTANIFITKFVGIVAAGCYSNYSYITNTLKTVYTQILSPIVASIGNYNAKNSTEKRYYFYNKLYFITACIAIFCSSCLFSLVNDFIKLVWGEGYVFDTILVVIIVFNFYLNCMRQPNNMFIDTNGLFWQIKWKSIIEAVVNVSAIFILVKICKLDILGVLLGMSISGLTTNFWWEPYVVFKYALNTPLRKYFKKYAEYSLVLIISIFISSAINAFFPVSILGFLMKMIVSGIIPVLLIIVFYHKSDDFIYFKGVLIRLSRKFIFSKIVK